MMDAVDAEMSEMFQKEFKKLHLELANKEIKLFKHMFNHYFSKRIIKIEQFLKEYFDDFGSFKPIERKHSQSFNSSGPTTFGSNIGQYNNTPAKRGPKPKGTGQSQNQKVKVKSEPYPGLDDEEIDLINGFQGHFLDEASDDGMTGRQGRDSDDDDDDFSCFALPNLDTSTSKANGSNGGGSGSGAKCGRKRNAIWQCYETTFGDDGKVLTNDCLRCGQAVSAKAGRMRSHLMKCREIMREATRYKKIGGEPKKPRNQYSQGNQYKPNPNYNNNSSSSTNQSISNNSTSAYGGGTSSTSTVFTSSSAINYGTGGNNGSNSNYGGSSNSTLGNTYTGNPAAESYDETNYHGGTTPGSNVPSDGMSMPRSTIGPGLSDSASAVQAGPVQTPCSNSSPSEHAYVGSSSGSA